MPGELLRLRATVTNTGTALWRPSTDQVGPVRLGLAWVRTDGTLDYVPRQMLPPVNAFGFLPTEYCELVLEVNAPVTEGMHRLRLQLVAEMVCWFGNTAEVTVEVQV